MTAAFLNYESELFLAVSTHLQPILHAAALHLKPRELTEEHGNLNMDTAFADEFDVTVALCRPYLSVICTHEQSLTYQHVSGTCQNKLVFLAVAADCRSQVKLRPLLLGTAAASDPRSRTEERRP